MASKNNPQSANKPAITIARVLAFTGILAAGAAIVLASPTFLLKSDTKSPDVAFAVAEPTPVESQEVHVETVGEALARIKASTARDGLLSLLAASNQPAVVPGPEHQQAAPQQPANAHPVTAVVPGSGGADQVVFELPPAAPAPSDPAPQTDNPPPPPPAPGCPTASMGGAAAALADAINAQRLYSGLSSLAYSGCAAYVAQARASDMASRGYFSHTSPDGSDAFSLLSANSVPYSWAAENIARNNAADAAGSAMTSFMQSSAHAANILGGNFTQIGVGVAVGADGLTYFAVVFIG